MEKVLTYHPETYLLADQLGTVIPAFQPNFPFSEYINDHHRFLSHSQDPQTGLLLLTAPGLMEHRDGVPINGWLRIEDALKLYELGFCCDGNILELGSYEGLSTCILAQALIDSGRAGTVSTVDLTYRHRVADNARECGVGSRVKIITADAAAAVRSFSAQRFGFIFVDHSHTYQDVKAICPLLREVASEGAFVLFHDYNDPRNGKDGNYGVYQAVVENLPAEFQFCGVYGCAGLYRAG
jgi:hypothetical protein